MVGDDDKHVGEADESSASAPEKKDASRAPKRPSKPKWTPQLPGKKLGPGAGNVTRKPMIAWRGSGR